jgi:hypothetical protein
MSCLTVPTQNAESILDQRVVNLIQTSLSTLSWLELCYGFAEPADMKKEDGSLERFPRVYKNHSTKEYVDVRYDDTLKALAFFERESDFQFGNDTDDEVTYQLSIVVWANLSRVDPSRTYDFRDLLAGDVLRILKYYYQAEINNIRVDLRSENAYSKYTLQDVDNRFITLPYVAFKVTFDYTEFKSSSCYTFNSIGGTPC